MEAKKERKIKRQVSIFTVMLWIFLITTMITITVNSTKKTNALEVEDENWNIQLVMYDRSSDIPDQAITEFTWNAVNENETKQLCMQINYACTTNKGYQPGEIEITIPGIAKDSLSEYWRNDDFYNYGRPVPSIAADQMSTTIKKYDWSYSYDEINNIYTFINNKVIEENEHFEGTIQLVYNLKPRFRIKTDLEYRAKIKENIENTEEIIAKQSNVCNFHYTSTKKIYGLTKKAVVAPKVDYTKINDILNDYYWVRYEFVYSFNNGTISCYGGENKIISKQTACIKEVLPEGCVLYDEELNKIDENENGEYYYLKGIEYSQSVLYGKHYYYYVGYPKSKYNEGDKITNIAEIWGRYEDEEEIQKLKEASVEVNLTDFDFEYKGELYSIKKSTIGNHKLNKNTIENLGEETPWYLSADAFYTGDEIDVEIGDDLLYVTRENGEITRLNDNEYNFTKIEIPKFCTYNKYSGSSGKTLVGYKYEVQVRYKDTSEYIVYKEGITSDNYLEGQKKYQDIVYFDRDDIVGVKVVIRDLDETLYQGKINVYTNIKSEDCKVGGYVYNFDYLQVYKKDETENRILLNEASLDSYNTVSTELKVAEYDIETYEKYIQRNFEKVSISDGSFYLSSGKKASLKNNNVKDEKYEAVYTLISELKCVKIKVDKDVIVKQYDILPDGVIISESKEEIIDNITLDLPYQNLKLKDGTIFNTKEELQIYIKENTTIDIDYNYKESGRTKISIIYNLNEIDWSYYLINSFNRQYIYKF